MAWYWWLLIGWILSAFLAMALEMRDNPKMRENVGFEEAWPMIFGPGWLVVKLCHMVSAWGSH